MDADHLRGKRNGEQPHEETDGFGDGSAVGVFRALTQRLRQFC